MNGDLVKKNNSPAKALVIKKLLNGSVKKSYKPIVDPTIINMFSSFDVNFILYYELVKRGAIIL